MLKGHGTENQGTWDRESRDMGQRIKGHGTENQGTWDRESRDITKGT